MNKIVFIFIILILNISCLFSQEIGSIFIGSNHYLSADEDNPYNVNGTGISIGLLIPIKLPVIDVFYKVKASHHTIKYYCSCTYGRELDYFFSVTNEILVGKRIVFNDKITLIPQAGFGAIGEAVYYDWDKGYTHGEAFVDISIISFYDIKIMAVGIMVNFEKDVIPSAESYISDKRLNISLLFSK